MGAIKFGTDGWRAIIAEEFTYENVRRVSQAVADYIKVYGPRGASRRIVVGFDTRFMGGRFAAEVAGVLSGNGISVFLSDGPTSTPALSLAIKQNRFIGGVMVTASHNPPHYNGIKYKADYAGPASPEIIKKIENFLGPGRVNSISLDDAEKKNLLKRINLNKPHLNFMKSYLDMKALKKMRADILVDVMYGAGGRLIENILKDTPSSVRTIHSEANPGFGGVSPEPIERNLKDLIGFMKKGKYDIGLATDGDADRIGAVSPGGKYITSSQIIALLLMHFVEDKKWTGAVAKTISGSFLIDEIAGAYKLKLYETPVGFKHICELMCSDDVLIGGEESGGIGFKNYVPERDGTLAGLLLLEMMAHRKKSIRQILGDMEKRFGKFCQQRIDMEYPDKKKTALFSRLKEKPPASLLDKKIVEIKTYDGVKFICEDKSWLLFRASGTEPILRIYCEGRSGTDVKKLLNLGKGIANL